MDQDLKSIELIEENYLEDYTHYDCILNVNNTNYTFQIAYIPFNEITQTQWDIKGTYKILPGNWTFEDAQKLNYFIIWSFSTPESIDNTLLIPFEKVF